MENEIIIIMKNEIITSIMDNKIITFSVLDLHNLAPAMSLCFDSVLA